MFKISTIKSFKLFLLGLSLFCIKPLSSQVLPYDTLKVISYNTLNYGFAPSADCPGLIPANKHVWLRTILSYEQPDLLALVKNTGIPTTFVTDTVLQVVLDSICNGCYGYCGFSNYSGYNKADMLYYKKDKLGWLGTTTIYSADNNISDINLHKLYYKSPTLSTTHDTIFLNAIVVHLKSGSSSGDERASEILGVMDWLNTNVQSPGNYLFMGDFNTQSSTESCYQQIVGSTNANTQFADPVNQPGDWSTDPDNFAQYLTQSTRLDDLSDCGASGGMNDRFDHILCSLNIMNGVDSIQYKAGSYNTLGQDGQHTNTAIINPPANTSVPSNVLNALYYMSEHLPVTITLQIGGAPFASGNKNAQNNSQSWKCNTLANQHLLLSNLQNPIHTTATATIYDLAGKIVFKANYNSENTIDINLSPFSNGMYILLLTVPDTAPFIQKFVKTASAE